jgi:hypothetical protein
MGFNFQKHIESALGDKLQRPLQKFHGSQIENLFKEQDAIWQRDPLKSAIEALQDDNAVGVYIRDLLKGWKAVSMLHSLVNTHPSKPAEMKKAVKEYRSAFSTFEFELPGATPKACLMKRRFYDHATLDHLVEQAERLHQMGFSHGVMSSRWLEGNNRPAKAHARMLPGGGQGSHGGFGNDPLWLILQHLTQHNFVKRRVHQKEAIAKMQAGQEVQRLSCDETFVGTEQAGQVSSAQGSSRTNPLQSGRDTDIPLHVAMCRNAR